MAWSQVYSVVDVVSTSLSVPIAIAGFWIAISQIRKTRAAAEAARDTAATARADARRAAVLVLIPQLQRIDEQIEAAIEAHSPDLLTAWANTWRWQASQLNQYLQTEPLPSAVDLPQQLQASVLAAANVKQGLKNATAWTRRTKRLSETVTAVTNNLGALAVQYAELPDRSAS